MPRLIVEIHVPLTPITHVAEGDYEHPWIDEVEEHLAQLDAAGELEVYDDGEELSGEHLFFITGRPEEQLLPSASRVVAREGVPAGTYAVINTDDGDMGVGRRVELPV